MKASDYVPLLLIGSVITANIIGNNDDLDVKQQRYNSRDDCEVDWGAPEHCYEEYSSSSDGGYSKSGRYLGPRYYWDRELGQPIELLPNGETRALSHTSISSSGSTKGLSMDVGSYSRGGFGSSSRGFTAGG